MNKVFHPKILVFGAFLLASSFLRAADPDCKYSFRFTNRAGESTDGQVVYAISGATSTVAINNKNNACTAWSFQYDAEGLSALSIVLQSAPSTGSASIPGTFSTFAGSTVTGSNPSSSTTSSTYTATGYYPFVRISLASSTGTGSINVTLNGWKSTAFLAVLPTGIGCTPGSTDNILAGDGSGNCAATDLTPDSVTTAVSQAGTALQPGVGTTVNGQSCVIGSTCTITAVPSGLPTTAVIGSNSGGTAIDIAGAVVQSSSKSVLRDIKSVKDPAYGAVCDGTTDDQTALQAAFTSGGNIHIPEGVTCLHSATVNIPSNTSIFCEGSGATLKSTGTVHVALQFNSADNSAISNCNLVNTTGAGRVSNQDAAAILAFTSTNITISNNHINGGPGPGIFVFGASITSSHDVIVSGNTIFNVKSNGTITYSSYNVTYVGNLVDNSGDACYEETTNLLQTLQTHDVLVTGNTCRNSVAGLLTAGTYRVSFIGNTVETTTSQPCAEALTNGGTYPATTDVTFENNRLSNCGNGGIFLNGVSGGLVKGNYITDTTIQGISMDSSTQDHITIEGNKIERSASHGIYALGNVNGLTITNNDVNVVTSGSCVRVSNTTAAITNLVVSGNFCDNITLDSNTFGALDLVNVVNLYGHGNVMGTITGATTTVRTSSSTFGNLLFFGQIAGTQTGNSISAALIAGTSLIGTTTCAGACISGATQPFQLGGTAGNGLISSTVTTSTPGFFFQDPVGPTNIGAVFHGNSSATSFYAENFMVGARTGIMYFIHGNSIVASGRDNQGVFGWGSASATTPQFQISTAGLLTRENNEALAGIGNPYNLTSVKDLTRTSSLGSTALLTGLTGMFRISAYAATNSTVCTGTVGLAWTDLAGSETATPISAATTNGSGSQIVNAISGNVTYSITIGGTCTGGTGFNTEIVAERLQ